MEFVMFQELPPEQLAEAEPRTVVLEQSSCVDETDMADWVQRKYTKGQIDRAGEFLVPWWKSPQPVSEYSPEDSQRVGEAWMIARNWRASHALPLLAFRMGLTSRIKRVDDNGLVAQRLKRMISVMNKLTREHQMKLSQMQDLGGCRAIVSSVQAVNTLRDLYRGPLDLFADEGSIKCYDYISEPKPDGYRGIHIVGRYHAKKQTNEHWNGHRVEIQLRTRLQHAFSTSVETVTTFTRNPLKFGGGPEDWRRFFALTGSAFAMREGTAFVPNTPSDPSELIRELKELTKSLKVRQRLAGWARALKRLPRSNIKDFKWLLLVLNVDRNTIKVTCFETRARAANTLDEIELKKDDSMDAVLVWVNSVNNLKTAYPNYYADTGEFISALDEVLSQT
jgi:hypothetical protein